MANPYKGQTELKIGDKTHVLIYDLNALAELQEKLGLSSLEDVLAEFQKMDFKTLRILLWAGLIHAYMEDDGTITLSERTVGSWIGREVTLLECTNVLTTALNRAIGEQKDQGKNDKQSKMAAVIAAKK